MKGRDLIADWIDRARLNDLSHRLGLIDKAVVEYQADPTKWGEPLLRAHDEVIALTRLKLRAGAPEMFGHPEIFEHAKATSEHLGRIGLGDHRLNQEILRLFNGFVRKPEPVHQAAA